MSVCVCVLMGGVFMYDYGLFVHKRGSCWDKRLEITAMRSVCCQCLVLAVNGKIICVTNQCVYGYNNRFK